MTESPTVNIRTGALSDIEAIAQFNIDMARETESLNLNPAVITAGVRGMIENPSRGFYLVVDAVNGNGEKVIAASLMVTTEWSDWRNGLLWWIQSVYVLPEWRRHGLYRAMYQRVKELSETADNVCGFRLYVEKDNINAQKTYSALGMEATHYLLFEELSENTDFLL